jgi:hypothetical protein
LSAECAPVFAQFQFPDHLVSQPFGNLIQRLNRLGNVEAEDERVKLIQGEGFEAGGIHAEMLSIFPCAASGFSDERDVANGQFERFQKFVHRKGVHKSMLRSAYRWPGLVNLHRPDLRMVRIFSMLVEITEVPKGIAVLRHS